MPAARKESRAQLDQPDQLVPQVLKERKVLLVQTEQRDRQALLVQTAQWVLPDRREPMEPTVLDLLSREPGRAPLRMPLMMLSPKVVKAIWP